MQFAPGSRVVVMGLGVSGMAAARYLRSRGANVAVSEHREIDRLGEEEREFCSGLELESGGHTREFILAADGIVPSPGVPLDLAVLREAAEQGIPIVGELALAADRIRVPVIAVTGSNGKTTVTGLIGTLLEEGGRRPFVGGNIGTPLLAALEEPEDHDVLVLELSSFQLDLGGGFRPDIGLLLNLSPDHLDRHGSMEAYVRAKMNLFGNQRASDTAVLGGDDLLVMQQAASLRAKVLTFGHEAGNHARINGSRVMVDGRIYELAGTLLDTRVNRLNAAAAILAALNLGVTPEVIRRGLEEYTPPEHRMTLVAESGGVRFINDSKATNVGAMAAALESCPPGVVLIAGGRDKDGDFSLVRDLVRERVERMICIGEAAPMLVEFFSGDTRVEQAEDMEDAVEKALGAAGEGQVVLLAPGCASFDMYKGYAERGRDFARAVAALTR